MLQGALPREVVQTTCDCIKDILRVTDKLQGLSRKQGTEYWRIPLTPSKMTGKKRHTRTRLQPVEQPAHTHIKAWVAVVAGGHATTYGATFGANHPHNQKFLHQGPMLALEAEYTAVQRVLMVVPAELHLQIVCCSMQGMMDMPLNLDRWNRGGWVYQDGSSIPRVSVLQQIFELLTCREHQVQWKVSHTTQPHKPYVELVEVLTVGVRLAHPHPPLSGT